METTIDDECWPLVGLAVRTAESLGLHRDPSLINLTIGVVEIEVPGVGGTISAA